MVSSKRFVFIFSFCAAGLLFSMLFSSGSYAADIGNCLMCHKYPGLSRIDENGKFRLMYVNEDYIQ